MAIIKLSVTERRRLSAFFTCLVLAFVAWIITDLSNPYKYTVKGILEFKNAPQRRAFHPLQSDTINMTISGTGWDMLFSKMNSLNSNILVDLRSLEYKSYVVLSTQIDAINNNSKRENNQPITSFNPDTLYFDFSNRKEKRVPVHLISLVKYQRQFFQSGPITLNPAYVIINGPSAVIDKITSWDTDTLKLDSVDESVVTRIDMQPVKEGNLNMYPKSVQATIPVDEFTEKVLEIPVKVLNAANIGEVKIFPQKVKITFTTSLSRYAEIDEDFFEATANLDLWRKNGYKTLPVVLSKIPDYCHIVKIEPRNIDFIIKE